jgi:hypothetical protein
MEEAIEERGYAFLSSLPLPMHLSFALSVEESFYHAE